MVCERREGGVIDLFDNQLIITTFAEHPCKNTRDNLLKNNITQKHETDNV